MDNITIFTVDCGDIPLEETKKYKICLDRLKEILPKNVNFKIFTKEDQIVKDCFKEFKDYFNLIKLEQKTSFSAAYISDVIRIYILSKNKHYLYLDADIYIKDFSFLEELKEEALYINECSTSIMYSGDDEKKFEKILDFYKKQKHVVSDSAVIDFSKKNNIGIKKSEFYCNCLHFFGGMFRKTTKILVFFKRYDKEKFINIKENPNILSFFFSEDVRKYNIKENFNTFVYWDTFNMEEMIEVIKKVFPEKKIVVI